MQHRTVPCYNRLVASHVLPLSAAFSKQRFQCWITTAWEETMLAVTRDTEKPFVQFTRVAKAYFCGRVSVVFDSRLSNRHATEPLHSCCKLSKCRLQNYGFFPFFFYLELLPGNIKTLQCNFALKLELLLLFLSRLYAKAMYRPYATELEMVRRPVHPSS